MTVYHQMLVQYHSLLASFWVPWRSRYTQAYTIVQWSRSNVIVYFTSHFGLWMTCNQSNLGLSGGSQDSLDSPSWQSETIFHCTRLSYWVYPSDWCNRGLVLCISTIVVKWNANWFFTGHSSLRQKKTDVDADGSCSKCMLNPPPWIPKISRHMEVFENGGTTISSIKIGDSIINNIFWGSTIYENSPMFEVSPPMSIPVVSMVAPPFEHSNDGVSPWAWLTPCEWHGIPRWNNSISNDPPSFISLFKELSSRNDVTV